MKKNIFITVSAFVIITCNFFVFSTNQAEVDITSFLLLNKAIAEDGPTSRLATAYSVTYTYNTSMCTDCGVTITCTTEEKVPTNCPESTVNSCYSTTTTTCNMCNCVPS